MNELILIIPIFIVLHFLDALFTVLGLIKESKRVNNPEDYELNYHRYFFKKFGIIKGTIISIPISTITIIVIIIIVAYISDIKLCYVIIGMQWMAFCSNLMQYITCDSIYEKIMKKEQTEVKQ